MNTAYVITWKNRENRWQAAGPVQATRFSYNREGEAIDMVITPFDKECIHCGEPDKIAGKYRYYDLNREVNPGELDMIELMKMGTIENIKRRL